MSQDQTVNQYREANMPQTADQEEIAVVIEEEVVVDVDIIVDATADLVAHQKELVRRKAIKMMIRINLRQTRNQDDHTDAEEDAVVADIVDAVVIVDAREAKDPVTKIPLRMKVVKERKEIQKERMTVKAVGIEDQEDSEDDQEDLLLKAQVMKANIVVTTKNAPAKTKAGVAVNVEDGREETFAHVNQEAMQKETQRVVHLKSRSSQQTMTL